MIDSENQSDDEIILDFDPTGEEEANLTFSTPDEMQEALEMTAHKIGRILNGDPKYKDSWHDIIGYIRLIEKDLID